MKLADLISLPIINTSEGKTTWKAVLTTLLIIIITGVMGLVLAYLNVSGDWLIAAVLMAIVPALVILHWYPLFGLFVWLLLTPFLLHTQSDAARQVYWIIHRFLPVLSLLFMVISTTFGVKKRNLPKFTPVEYSMVAYIVLSIISILLWNNDTLATIYRFYDLFIIPMCLYWLIRLYVPSEKSMQLLVPLSLFITVTQVGIGILSWVYPSVLPSAWLEYAGARTTGSLNSVSVYTTTLFFTGLILLNAGLQSKVKWKRYLYVLLFFSTLYTTFISYSRASWLAGIIILIGLVLIYPKFMGKLILVGGILVVLMGSLLWSSGVLQTAASRLVSSESQQSALSRLPVFVAAYRMFKEKPILGWGYDNFDRYDRRYQARFGELVNPDEKDHTSHNVYLTMLAEQGLLGISFYLFPFASLFMKSRKTIQNLPKRGLLNDKMFISLWLVILSFFIVQNLAPMVVVFGLGLNWITLGLIANYVHLYGSRS